MFRQAITESASVFYRVTWDEWDMAMLDIRKFATISTGVTGVTCNPISFEMDLAGLVYLRCLRLHEQWKREGKSGIKSFTVASNVEYAGKIADIVVRVKYVAEGVVKNKQIFVFCKHNPIRIDMNHKKRFQGTLCVSKAINRCLKAYGDIYRCSKSETIFGNCFTEKSDNLEEELDVEVIYYSYPEEYYYSDLFETYTKHWKEADITESIFNTALTDQSSLKLKDNIFVRSLLSNEEPYTIKKQFCERFRVFPKQSDLESLILTELALLTVMDTSINIKNLSARMFHEVNCRLMSTTQLSVLTEQDNLIYLLYKMFHPHDRSATADEQMQNLGKIMELKSIHLAKLKNDSET